MRDLVKLETIGRTIIYNSASLPILFFKKSGDEVAFSEVCEAVITRRKINHRSTSCADKCKNLRNKEKVGFHGSRKKSSGINSSTPTNSTPASGSKCLGMVPKYT